MCIWDSYVYQKGVLCFLIHKSYVRSIKRYCFVRKYAAIPVQLEIIIIIIIIIIIKLNRKLLNVQYMLISFQLPRVCLLL